MSSPVVEPPSRLGHDIILVRDAYDYDDLLISYPELDDLKVYAIDRRRFIDGALIRNIYITRKLQSDWVLRRDEGLYRTARQEQIKLTLTGKTIVL